MPPFKRFVSYEYLMLAAAGVSESFSNTSNEKTETAEKSINRRILPPHRMVSEFGMGFFVETFGHSMLAIWRIRFVVELSGHLWCQGNTHFLKGW
jgi:hypothetical protein